MDNTFHPMSELFTQLGLPSTSVEIESFFERHQLQAEQSLFDAAFFSAGQKQFLHEALAADSDWAEIVDQLDLRLRE